MDNHTVVKRESVRPEKTPIVPFPTKTKDLPKSVLPSKTKDLPKTAGAKTSSAPASLQDMLNAVSSFSRSQTAVLSFNEIPGWPEVISAWVVFTLGKAKKK